MTNQTVEMLDLVDKNDQIIGEVEKDLANTDTKYTHREVAIMLVDKDNKILFQKRSATKIVAPNKWIISVAGHVTKGQTADEAAHRELEEELGFDTKLRFLGKTYFAGENETHFTYWFVGEYNGEKIIVDPRETQKYEFLSEAEMDASIKSGNDFSEHIVIEARRYWAGEFK